MTYLNVTTDSNNFGGVLILIGIAVVAIQMVLQVKAPRVKFPTRKAAFSVRLRHKPLLVPRYPGLVMILLGVALEIVGHLATAPWK